MTLRRIIIAIPDNTGQNIESNIHKSDLKAGDIELLEVCFRKAVSNKES